MKVQVRKTLATAAYADASRVVTFSGSETTAGLAPAMPVTGTGIPASTTITTVDTATTITLSANPTGGTLTGQSLVFSDLNRVAHVNGSEVLATGDSMLTIATGTGGDPVLFNARRYVGTGLDNKEITGFGFQPDLVWFKSRSNTYWHHLFDSLRPAASGGHPYLYPNDTDSSIANTDSLHTMNTDGVTLGTSTNTNGSSATYIAWAWKAGGTAVSNTDGSLTSSVSANVAGGFSIVSYTGGGSAATLGHGLSSAPEMMIVKRFDGGSGGWAVYHEGTDASAPEDKYLQLQSNVAAADATWPWNDTAPTSSVFSVGSDTGISGSGFSYIAYCFHAVAGVSAFGSYEGNASTNTITYTGSNSFTAKFIMIKNLDASAHWCIFDTARGELIRLYANDSGSEVVDINNTVHPTITSTGFSFLSTVNSAYVNAANTYIYAAFA